jgi:3-oxoacyl-[acyl-carrier-protein] synthase-3
MQMACLTFPSAHIRGITTCVPKRIYDNLSAATHFTKSDVGKIVRMAGVKTRHVADKTVCASDLCETSAKSLMDRLGWEPKSIDALIMVTHTPDYFQPATACILQHKLNLTTDCLAFDIEQGCSGYPYGLMSAVSMLQGNGIKRILLLHGDTPTQFTHPEDRSCALLFGDAGSATAIEAARGLVSDYWHFSLNTDGSGYKTLIIKGGGFRKRFPDDIRDHYLSMDGAALFNFTIKRVPGLISDTLKVAGTNIDHIDYFIFHQSNQFMMKHLLKKIGVPPEKVPFTIRDYGNTGGPSVPLTITNGNLKRPKDRPIILLLIAYGVGLSWGSALITLNPSAILRHIVLDD